MTLSSANESGSALNPFSKSIKRELIRVGPLPAYSEITGKREKEGGSFSGQQVQAGGHYLG